ncbi:hypothetical protein [Natrinema hispanicum]|uniref:Uncharacterized protein n=1 Tax=Natrinema hispanicum TaxID=392421 RepID=A0A1G6V1S3_9EURY|nr:hypothetical protein [Natrinema hispanicum]SDD46815.1 hypothetical protein SAMN05192552_102438 [Natrinema hispanicum]
MQIGTTETFYDTNAGDYDRGGMQFGNNQAYYNESTKEAQAAVKASLGALDPRGIWAWAEAGREFTVEGSGEEYVSVEINTNLDGSRSAFADAWSTIKVSYHLVHLDADGGPEEVDNKEVFLEDSFLGELVYFDKYFHDRVSGKIGPGEYYAYARLKCKAGAAFPGSSISEAHPSGDHDGDLTVNSIQVYWE